MAFRYRNRDNGRLAKRKTWRAAKSRGSNKYKRETVKPREVVSEIKGRAIPETIQPARPEVPRGPSEFEIAGDKYKRESTKPRKMGRAIPRSIPGGSARPAVTISEFEIGEDLFEEGFEAEEEDEY